jgi:hypothetical protein
MSPRPPRAVLVLLAASLAVAADPPGEARSAPAAEEARIQGLLEAERWEQALGDALAFHARAPQEPAAAALLGAALLRAGRLAEAERVLEPLAGSPSAPARGLVALARLREARGRQSEAVDLMRRAVAAAPADREVLYLAADVSGDRAEAVSRLERYLALCAGDREERIESAQGTLRLLRALGTRPTWVARDRPERVEVALSPLWIPETGQVIGYHLKARIGERGRAVPLLLDTGSPGLFVIERTARKTDFAPLAEVTLFEGGGTGRHATRRGFFSRLTLERLVFADALASVAPQEIDPYGRFHGLLGLAPFDGYRVTIDLARDRLVLERGAPGAAAGTPYYVVSGQMLVPAETSAGPGLFLFDTGATHTLVADRLVAAAAGARLVREAGISAFGGMREGARVVAGFEVRFAGQSTGSRELRAADLTLRSRVTGVEVAGFLGLDLLEGKIVEIDTVGRTVALREP